MTEPRQTIEEAIQEAGFLLPREIVWDGKIHRFPTDSHKVHSKDGWYVAFDHARGRAAAFGSWREGSTHTWSDSSGRKLTIQERASIEEQRKAAAEALKLRHAQAAALAQAVYAKAERVGKSAYLERKKIKLPAGVRFVNNLRSTEIGCDKDFTFSALAVPMSDKAGVVRSIQFIKADGAKFFLPGGEAAGCCFVMGSLHNPACIFLCEGLATGATIFEAMAMPVVVAFSAGNLAPVCRWLRKQFKEAEIIVCADDDEAGRKGAEACEEQIIYPEGTKDFNDMAAEYGILAVKARLCEQEPETPWTLELITKETDSGRKVMVKCLANYALLLEHHADWQGVLSFDEFANRIVPARTPPIPLDDIELLPHHFSEIRIWLERKIFRGAIPKDVVNDAILAAAMRRRTHQVRDWLAALSWDGIERCPSLFADMVGCEMNEYTVAVSLSFVISAVARVCQPGCQVDTLVVLEGPQGIRKSTILKALFGKQWHGAVSANFRDKDFFQNLRGKWVMVFDDLHGMSNADRSMMKQIISSSTDHYRASYAAQSQDWDRHCIFAATTNERQYMDDPTGTRRLLPIACREINCDYVKENREQIWAEAYMRFNGGEGWWEIPCAEDEQEKRFEIDPWEEAVANALAEREREVAALRHLPDSTYPYCETKPEWLMTGCIGLLLKDITRIHKKRVADILKRLGYEEAWPKDKNRQTYRVYRKRVDSG